MPQLQGGLMDNPLTPVPLNQSKAMTMSFFDALKAIQANKRVARLSWGNKDYCLMEDGWLSIYIEKDKKVNGWLVSEGDMEGQDWIIVTEPN